VNSTVRLRNLLLMMRQRVDVKADEFQDSLGPVAEVVSSKFRVVRRSLRFLGDCGRALSRCHFD